MVEIVNPYIAGAPVVETRMFFGREDVFDWIQKSLTGRYADHTLVIHGQRRVGKTSVLKQLGNRLPKNYIPVFFDLQGRTHTTLDRFLWWLAREILRVLKQERDITFPVPEKEVFSQDIEYFEHRFLPDLRTVLGENVLLLTFDEFDNLEESEIKEELAIPLIDYLRRLMGLEGLNFIFSIGSSGRKLENMQASYTQFFKAALYKKISFLSKDQSANLITRPVEGVLEYTSQAVDRIYDITSGHPYFTQLICHELFSVCQQTEILLIQEKDVEAVLEDVVERGTVNLKFVWDEASDIEKWSLASLTHLEGKADAPALANYLRKQHVRFIESDLTSGLLRLQEKDILNKENRFVIYLLRLWLKKNRPIEQVREELIEVNPIANRYIEIGMEFQDSGQFEKAIENFHAALVVAPEHVQAQVNIAQVYMAQNAYDKAIIEFEKALTMDDEDMSARAGLCEAHLALGDMAMTRGRFKEAGLSYRRVLEINAEHTDARGRMAELSRQHAEKALIDGKDEEALSAFTEALQFTPEDQSLMERVEKIRAEKKAKVLTTLLGRSEKEAGARNWEKSLATLNEVYEIAPQDKSILTKINFIKARQLKEQLDTILGKAAQAEKSSRWDAAISLLGEYLALQPDDEAIQKRLATLRATKRSSWLMAVRARADVAGASECWEEAIAALNEVLLLEPGNTEFTRRMEEIRTSQKDSELTAIQHRALQAAMDGHWDEAVDALNAGLAIEPENEILKGKLADAHTAKHEAHVKVTLQLADSAARAGKWEASVAILNEVLANEPDNAEFQKKLTDVRTQEHTTKWDAARLKVEGLREAEQFEAAFQVWQAYLPLYPEDRERVEEEIKQVTKGSELHDLYSNAGLAVTNKDYNQAINLLKEVIIRDENYKDASRLLTKSIELRRTAPGKPKDKTSKASPRALGPDLKERSNPKSRKRIFGILGSVVVIAMGIFLVPKVWNSFSLASMQTPPGIKILSVVQTLPADLVSINPILAYISTKSPDFEDDFSNPNKSRGQIAEGIQTADLIQDGVLHLTLEAGTPTEKIDPVSQMIRATNFVLEYDFYFEDSIAASTSVNIGFSSIGDGSGKNCAITINMENQTWSVGLTDGTIGSSGNISQPLQGRWSHLRMLYYDNQVTAFLNGELLDHVEGIAKSGEDIWIITVTDGWAKIWLDNVKFWNLGGMDFLASTAIPAAVTVTALPTVTTQNPISEIEADHLFFSSGVSNSAITSISWSTSGTRLGIASSITRVDIINILTKEVLDYIGWPETINSASWFPGGLWMTIGSNGGDISTRDYTQITGITPSGNLYSKPIGDASDLYGSGTILDLKYTVDGNQLISGTAQGYLATWRREGDRWVLIENNQIDEGPIFTVDWNQDGTSFLTVGRNNGLQIWSTTLKSVQKQLGYTSTSADWSPNGSFIAFEDRSLQDGYAYLYLIEPGGTEISKNRLDFFINKIAWSPDNKMIATAGSDGRVLLWGGIEDGLLEPVFQLKTGSAVTEVAWSPDGTMLAAGRADGQVWVWNLEGIDFSTSPNNPAPPTLSASTPQPSWVTDSTEPILATIAGHTPNVQENCDNGTYRDWIKAAQGIDNPINGECIFSNNQFEWNYWYTDYVIEMDARILSGDRWAIYFRGFQGYFLFTSEGAVLVGHEMEKRIEDGILSGQSINHLRFIVKNQAVALFVNDMPTYYGVMPAYTGYKNGSVVWGIGSGVSVAFDNIKIWNLNDIQNQP
jgi:tetratricopeptide (TPR) repeat protein/WD40 repeat protein